MVADAAGPGTGRLTRAALPGARRIVFGETADAAIDDELHLMTAVDRAHLVMLRSRGLIGAGDAGRLIAAIDDLDRDGYRALRGRHAPRGLYLLYESHLAEVTGAEVAGRLHSGRSRNDLKATICALRLREWHAAVLRETLRTEAVALNAARRHRAAVLAGFTHFQPSVPITYGYYLAGVAAALGREADRLLAEIPHLSRCPLGAGAMAGTDLPIDPELTARLLGFAAPHPVALDAVASRDSVSAVLAIAASVAVTASRVALDLQLWTSAEPALLRLPDDLVGSSSAMPQKRNAYLLEHVRGRAARVLGAQTAVLAATRSAPFTNSIEVGTEAMAEAWPAYAHTIDVLRLLRMHLSGARPRVDRMAGHAAGHWTTATAVANRLVVEGHPFRRAHEVVGRLITGIESGRPVQPGPPIERRAAELLDTLDVGEAVRAARFGGGPGPESFAALWPRLHAGLRGRAAAAAGHLDVAAHWRQRLLDQVDAEGGDVQGNDDRVDDDQPDGGTVAPAAVEQPVGPLVEEGVGV
ncbi:argininosuccinate lyase [Plantactinospora sp. DSM 117369]